MTAAANQSITKQTVSRHLAWLFEEGRLEKREIRLLSLTGMAESMHKDGKIRGKIT